MVALPLDRHTEIRVESYLALEDDTPVNPEYYKGEIFAMAGASGNHSMIAMNIGTQLNVQLLKRPDCTVHASDMRVRVSETIYFYPDVVAACNRQFADTKQLMLLNPALIVEVTSQSTALYDRTTKLEAYKQMPSVQEVLIVDQQRLHVDQYARRDDGWLVREFTEPDDKILLESLGCTLSISEVYAKVTFEA